MHSSRMRTARLLTVSQHALCRGCNSMPFGAAWAYYIKVLVLASTAS